ncbi:hypothetical protein [Marimonas arenosa]|uniref:Sulfotransferase family protein n=1 Tax=Marimonas arenosa TaxID=1795305 RepID=A0AAE4B4X3_9RHOB|nr:hypothetical protein [Marimonas arenosa]MDQ2090680.1 hypothetical protein [Marimonas arenosa]
MTQILVHAGFHKTGTTSVQQTLRENRGLLKERVVLALPWKLKPLLHAARAWSAYRDPLSLAKFTHRAEAFVAELPPLRHRGLIMCSEELSGHLPGRGGIPDYRGAVPLMGELTRALRRRFPDHDLRVVYSTRAPDAWLESAYWEQVKSSSQTMSLAAFRDQYTRAADFNPVLAAIRRAIAPASLESFALEDCAADRLGPAAPLLRLAGLDDAVCAGLTPLPPANTRLAQEALDHLLDLNRTHPDSADRAAAKQAYLDTL